MSERVSTARHGGYHERLLGRPEAWAELETPALCIDLDALEHNIAALARWARAAGVDLRPHVKTHKCAELARLQHAAGAVGVSAATLAEAEVMVAARAGQVLLTSPVVGRGKLERLAALHAVAEGRLQVVTDTVASVQELNALALAVGRPLDVLIEHHAGQARSGVDTAVELATLARAVLGCPQLRLQGLQHYGGHLQHIADPAERAAAVRASVLPVQAMVDDLRRDGIALRIITGVGTGTLAEAVATGFYTELQAGSYVFMDAQYADVHGADAALRFRQSLYVAARVTSVQSVSRSYVTVDAGQKALSIDDPGPRPREPAVTGTGYEFFGDEHGRWRVPPGVAAPERGARVDIVPGHCDPTVALYDVYEVLRGTTLVERWPIAARGH